MKKFTPFILSIALAMTLSISAFQIQAQTLVLSEYFTTYDGTAATIPAGWVFTYNGNYTTTQSSGVSGPNSYKFGVNNATITSPAFVNGDSLKFYIKGNGTDTISSLSIFQGPDTSNFSLLGTINPIPTSNGNFAYGLAPGTKHIRYVYTKSVGNVAFDDFEIFRNGPSSVSNVEKKQVLLYPNPARNTVSVDLGSAQNVDITLYNMIGKAMENVSVSDNGRGVYSLNLNNVAAGTYFMQIKADNVVSTRRLQVVK